MPIPAGPLAPQTAQKLATIRDAWPNPIDGAVQRRVQIAPLTRTYGQQPPITAGITPLELALIRSTWPDTYPLPQPDPRRDFVAPLTLVYGSRTVPVGSIDVAALAQLVASWQPVAAVPPRAPMSAAWNVPAVVAATVPASANRITCGLVAAAWRAEAMPFLPLAQRTSMAPLTLTYGDQPISGATLGANDRIAIDAWAPQSSRLSRALGAAAWDPGTITFVPSGPPSREVQLGVLVAAWQERASAGTLAGRIAALAGSVDAPPLRRNDANAIAISVWARPVDDATRAPMAIPRIDGAASSLLETVRLLSPTMLVADASPAVLLRDRTPSLSLRDLSDE